MDQYTATEEAYKRGLEKGETDGFRRGFRSGLETAGIAPIQWIDARELPFEPAPDQYYMIWLINKHDSMRVGRRVLADMPRMIHGSTSWGIGAVAYWCPVQAPKEVDNEETI